MNFTNFSSTGKTPTEVLFGFGTREALDFLRLSDSVAIKLPENESLPAAANDSYQYKHAFPTTADVPAIPAPQEAGPQQAPLIPSGIKYRPCHIDATDAIAFAAMRMKYYYDQKHDQIFFKEGDHVHLR